MSYFTWKLEIVSNIGGGGSGKGLETRKFPVMYSDNFYEKIQSLKAIAFAVFLQFRKDQQGGQFYPLPQTQNRSQTNNDVKMLDS